MCRLNFLQYNFEEETYRHEKETIPKTELPTPLGNLPARFASRAEFHIVREVRF